MLFPFLPRPSYRTKVIVVVEDACAWNKMRIRKKSAHYNKTQQHITPTVDAAYESLFSPLA